jgi:voltage-gated potassium channel
MVPWSRTVLLSLTLATLSSAYQPLRSTLIARSASPRRGQLALWLQEDGQEGADSSSTSVRTEVRQQRETAAAAAAAAAAADSDAPFGELPGAIELRRRFDSSARLELLTAVLVLVSGGIFAVETLPDLSPLANSLLTYAEDGIVLLFAAEFILRWYSRSLRPAFLLSPLVLVDLVSFAPFLLLLAMDDPERASYGFFGVLRLLRVLRLQRFVADGESFRNFQLSLGISPSLSTSSRVPYALQLARVLSSVFTLVFVATGLIYLCEHEANPAIPDYFTALYFGLTTLTTVGFGDITPITTGGRLVVCLSIVAGVAVIPIQLAELGEALLGKGGEEADPEVEVGVVTRGTGLTDAGAAPSQRWPTAQQGSSALPETFWAPCSSLLVCDGCGETVHLRHAEYCSSCGARLQHPEEAVASKE